MKIFKGKAFFIKSILLHIFLVFVISLISITFWENSFYDLFTKNVSQSANIGSKNIELIMIDDKSVDAYRWPWARSLYGEIFDYLRIYTNAKVVVFDAIITNPDTANPSSSDNYFYDVVKKSPNFIGGYKFLISSPTLIDKDFYNEFNTKNNIKIIDKRTIKIPHISVYKSVSDFPKGYFNSLKHIGSVNFVTEPVDGILRRSSDLIVHNGKLYPSLSLATYLLANGTNEVIITNKNIIVEKTGLKIPIYNTGYDIKHNIKFYKHHENSAYTHNKHSAIDIVESFRNLKRGEKPLIEPRNFDNKIVIIGGNAMNAEDVLHTPISLKQPGADIQATVIDNLLNGEYIIPFSPLQNISVIILLCIATFIIISRLSFIKSLITLLITAIIYLIICAIFYRHNIAPYIITPLAVQISTMIFGYSYRFILEGKNKEKIKNAMGKYLSQDIMKNVVQNIDDIKLGGKKSNLTVLFSDIRGFTSMSENMTAEEVSKILNEYFSEMEPIITKYNGVINKFIGDAVMAIFGEPIQDINHAQNAVKCACEMLKKVEQLRDKWLAEGKPKIEIGIGINTGEAFVGNIGSEKRLEYTVIGDTVNLASRIEGYNKVYKTNLLISSSTYKQVSDIVDVIKIADVSIRGKSKKMDIYEVLRLSN